MRSTPALSPLVVRQDDPFNGEAALDRLSATFVTPADTFFVRCHASIPPVDSRLHRLSVRGMVRRELSLAVDDLKRGFPQRVVTATLECAGNRRRELLAVQPIPGEVAWDAGAIGTAEWTGVALCDVLEEAGASSHAGHVAMAGLDRVDVANGQTPFGGSIPIDKARGVEVLVAYEMNGEPLAPAHGFPLRLVVPGYIGARSVKWLQDVVVQEGPSTNHFQANAYRWAPASGSTSGVALREISLNAVICRPRPLQARAGDRVRVEGYAIGTAGGEIERVEVSGDGARTWHEAEITGRRDAWSWRVWSAEVQTSRDAKELVVRGWDGTDAYQPSEAAAAWNVHGYVNNAWHRVALARV